MRDTINTTIEAFRLLYNIENSLRLFCYLLAKDHCNHNWLSETKRNDGRTLISVANERHKQAAGYGYMSFIDSCPLLYLTTDELFNVITSDVYWNNMSCTYFPNTNISIMKERLSEIRAIRNAVAHCRHVDDRSVMRLVQITNDLLSGINMYINSAILPFTQMPINLTNIKDPWYEDMASLTLQNVPIQLSMSVNKKWVSLQFKYTSARSQVPGDAPDGFYALRRHFNSITNGDDSSDNNYVAFTRLNTPHIINDQRTLRTSLAYVIEEAEGYIGYNPDASSNHEHSFEVYKNVHLVFSRSALVNNHKKVIISLRHIFKKIDTEHTTLVFDENAEVDYLDVGSIEMFPNYDEGDIVDYDTDVYNMELPRNENDAPEYWGPARIKKYELHRSEYFVNPPFFPWQGNSQMYFFNVKTMRTSNNDE